MIKDKSSKRITKSIPQSNKPITPLSTERPFYDYMSDNSMYHFPENDAWRKRVCFSLYEWALKETSLVMAQFNIEYKIKRTSLKEWRKKFPEIEEAYNEAKFIIGCRRQTGAMTNKLNGFYAYRDMHLYDPEWKEVDQYHKELKTEDNIKDKKVIIELHDLTKPEEKLEEDASRNTDKAK